MQRAHYKGEIGFERHIGWCIIAHNVVAMTRARGKSGSPRSHVAVIFRREVAKIRERIHRHFYRFAERIHCFKRLFQCSRALPSRSSSRPATSCRLLAKAIESASCESCSAEGEYVTNLSLNLLPYLRTIARNARSIRKSVKELRRLGG